MADDSPQPENGDQELFIPTKRSRLGRLMGVQVVGVGSSVPDNLVRNEDLASLGYDAEWIVQRTGILERRHAPPGTATSDLAVEAARRCIEDAGVDPQEIDLLLLGTYTPDQLLPATACVVQDRLGLCCPAMDLQLACAGFVYAMITAAQYIATGCSRLALAIGADCNSRVVNPADKHTFPLFGDAAGAVLLAPGSGGQGLVSFAVGSDGSGADLLCRQVGGSMFPFERSDSANGLHFLRMEGRPIFKWAVRVLNETIDDVLRTADMTLDEVDLVIFHQANMRIISSAVKDLGLDESKVYNNLQRYGNTSAASIPLALDEAYREGRIRRGDHVLMSGFGAGLAWGTVLVRW
jgi:3-oxoacyl-[acyl-carrier-protein] synthase-3